MGQGPRRDKRSSEPARVKKGTPLLAPDVTFVDYKDVNLLRKFISDRGKIRSRRVTGLTMQQQRAVVVVQRREGGAVAQVQVGQLDLAAAVALVAHRLAAEDQLRRRCCRRCGGSGDLGGSFKGQQGGETEQQTASGWGHLQGHVRWGCGARA